MHIILNGEQIETSQTNLADLLLEQGFNDLFIATALDQQFVAKEQRSQASLTDGCEVEVVAPMQGG